MDTDYISRRIAESVANIELEQNGSAAQSLWECEDGWVIGYTTERIKGGPLDGKFATLGYKPVGKSGDVERVYMRGFSQRKMAKARAIAMFGKHSPKWYAKTHKAR